MLAVSAWIFDVARNRNPPRDGRRWIAPGCKVQMQTIWVSSLQPTSSCPFERVEKSEKSRFGACCKFFSSARK
jgi:hypothetical protein